MTTTTTPTSGLSEAAAAMYLSLNPLNFRWPPSLLPVTSQPGGAAAAAALPPIATLKSAIPPPPPPPPRALHGPPPPPPPQQPLPPTSHHHHHQGFLAGANSAAHLKPDPRLAGFGPPPPGAHHPAFPWMQQQQQQQQHAAALNYAHLQHLFGTDKALAMQYLNDPLAKAALMDLSRGMGQYPLGKKLFGCPQCRYITDRKNNLKRHVATMHQECDKMLECCGVMFKNKASLRDHVLIFHSNGYMCRYCGRNFCRKALLKRHLTVHSGQKDFLCEHCDYATSHKSNLERHKKVHERPEGEDDDAAAAVTSDPCTVSPPCQTVTSTSHLPDDDDHDNETGHGSSQRHSSSFEGDKPQQHPRDQYYSHKHFDFMAAHKTHPALSSNDSSERSASDRDNSGFEQHREKKDPGVYEGLSLGLPGPPRYQPPPAYPFPAAAFPAFSSSSHSAPFSSTPHTSPLKLHDSLTSPGSSCSKSPPPQTLATDLGGLLAAAGRRHDVDDDVTASGLSFSDMDEIDVEDHAPPPPPGLIDVVDVGLEV